MTLQLIQNKISTNGNEREKRGLRYGKLSLFPCFLFNTFWMVSKLGQAQTSSYFFGTTIIFFSLC